MRADEVYLEDLCFDAQQAAEKAIKAVLIHYGMIFPFSHDLAQLLTILEDEHPPIPKSVLQAARLTRFAISARYPSFSEPVTETEYETVLSIAGRVLQWAEKIIEND